MQINKQNYGFTLIELLVVIAIISLLSSIVMASLGQARIKAKDAAVIGDLYNFRNEAEINIRANSDYGEIGKTTFNSGGVYSTDPPGGLDNICNDNQAVEILRQAALYTPSAIACFVGGNGNNWVVATRLPSQKGDLSEYYCIDSQGVSQKIPLAVVVEIADNTTNNIDVSCG